MNRRLKTDAVLVAGALGVLGYAATLQRRANRSARTAAALDAALDDGDAGAVRYGDAGIGRAAATPTDIPARGWWDVMVRIYGNISEHRVLAIGAGVTFYAILALFPTLAAFVSLFGLFTEPTVVLSEIDKLRGVVPDSGIEVISTQVQRISGSTNASLSLAFFSSLALAMWSSNAGMKALFDALNIVYVEREKRGFLLLNAISLLFTAGAILVMLGAVAAVIVLPIVLHHVPEIGGETLVRVTRWPVMFLVLSLALALLYRFGPSRQNARWRWLSPGSLGAAACWIAASMGFSWYAANFADYNETYGSLGAIIAFMIWIWISVVVILVGAELNAETEHQTARDTTTGAPLPVGMRGATMADTLGKTQSWTPPGFGRTR